MDIAALQKQVNEHASWLAEIELEAKAASLRERIVPILEAQWRGQGLPANDVPCFQHYLCSHSAKHLSAAIKRIALCRGNIAHSSRGYFMGIVRGSDRKVQLAKQIAKQ